MAPLKSVTAWFDSMRVEGEPRPVGLDIPHPEFTWVVREGGAEHPVTVLELAEMGAGAERVVWRRTLPVGAPPRARHDGPDLTPLTRYRWTLSSKGMRVAEASFSTGMFDSSDWAGARWISAPDTDQVYKRATPVPELATSFLLDDAPHFALLAVAAGGYAQPWLDGLRVGDSELGPAFSDYERRVHYETYDLTPLLGPGTHLLAFRLGRGFYGMTNPSPPPAWGWESAPWHDEPCVRAVLHMVDVRGARRTIVTDTSWTSRRTQTLYDDLYAGEVFDARASFPLEAARAAAGPRGTLQRQRIAPIRVTRTLAPVEVAAVGDGYVVDFGQIVSGRVRIRIDAPGTHEITLAHGEKLTGAGLPNVSDGEIYFSDGFQTDRCVVDGPGEWAPSFTYHGFRYVHVSGWPASHPMDVSAIRAEVLHSDIPRVGAFRSSDPLLNALHDAAVSTVEINLHGIPTDTPTYEKNGWTGDAMLAAELMLINLDSELFLEKWLDDIVDSCDDDGRPQVIAPSPGWGDRYKPSPPWHSDLVLAPWWLFRHRGNRRVLERNYHAMRRYVLRELADSDGGLVHSVLNDWCSPETGPWGGDAPDDHRVSGTAYLFHMLTVMSCVARVLSRSDDAVRFDVAAESVRAAFTRAFFDGNAYRGEGDEGYRQTHNILALAFGLVPQSAKKRVVDGLVADIRARGDHLNTGVLGAKHILPTLSRNGHAELALRVATQTTFPSWGSWVARGSTTLWEHWKEESRSRAHYMFGTYDDWFFQHVLGVTPTEPGYRRLRVAPISLTALDAAEGILPTPYGPVEVEWRTEGRIRRLHTRVPTGCVAEIVLRHGANTTSAVVPGGYHEMETRS